MDSPYSIILADGRRVDNLDFQNAAEQVRLYSARWVSEDLAYSVAYGEHMEHGRTARTLSPEGLKARQHQPPRKQVEVPDAAAKKYRGRLPSRGVTIPDAAEGAE